MSVGSADMILVIRSIIGDRPLADSQPLAASHAESCPVEQPPASRDPPPRPIPGLHVVDGGQTQ